jgi:hypothetical protein
LIIGKYDFVLDLECNITTANYREDVEKHWIYVTNQRAKNLFSVNQGSKRNPYFNGWGK